jgi:cytochrome P450
MGSVGAANRDPRVFEDPDRFDPKRRNLRRNIAFGPSVARGYSGVIGATQRVSALRAPSSGRARA